MKVKGFVTALYLRVDYHYTGYGGRPNLSLCADENSAMSTTTKEIEAKEKTSRTSAFVSDMPICPVSHEHPADSSQSGVRRVPSITRASKGQANCDIYTEKSYVSPV